MLFAGGCAPSLPDLGTEGSGSDGTNTESTGTHTTIDGTDTNATTDTDTATTDTDPEACGNGIVEVGELCDDGEESAACDVDCTDAICGDLNVNAAAGEACDGTELAGATCASQGFDGGTLACLGCAFDTSGCEDLPSAPVLELGVAPIKQFDFGWTAVDGVDHYELFESARPGEPFVQIGEEIVGESISLSMPLHLRFEASYVLQACNEAGCTASDPVGVMGSLVEAVGYFKASNTEADDDWLGDDFGFSSALSGDGNTLAVGAQYEDSSATGIDGNQLDNSMNMAGAVYVFVRDPMGQWSQQAYVKASNTGTQDLFGAAVALSDDGSTLAVGAMWENSSAVGVGGNQADDFTSDSGAVYVFARDEADGWSHQAYVKASNTDMFDEFGANIALSGDGNTLAVGAIHEDGNATGIGGNPDNDLASGSGAVYVFVRDGADEWSHQAYVKASNTDPGDFFGASIALSHDGDVLSVGATGEDSSATGIGGEQADDSAASAGAVYVFSRDGADQWSQHAYVKASNTDGNDDFGGSVALSDDGDVLAVGATGESSGATGIGGDQADDSVAFAGAVYVFSRDAADQWSQLAYIKASNPDPYDSFGAVALSGDGDVLAIVAADEASSATGIGGDQSDDSSTNAGAVYVFARDGADQWSQLAYVKASNTDPYDYFGSSIALSDDGHTLAVGAHSEASSATGIGGDQANDSAAYAGAVYLY